MMHTACDTPGQTTMATAIEPDFNCNSSDSNLDAGSLEEVSVFDEDSEVPKTVLVPKKVCQSGI